MFKTVKQPFFSAEDGSGDDLQSGKTFTQEDVDRIVGERLAREKASKADYDDLKEIAESLESFGYAGSVADKKAVLKQQAEEKRKAAEIEALEEKASATGITPAMQAKLDKMEAELEAIKKDKQLQQQEMEEKQKADESFKEQVTEFNEKHPDVDVAKLNENKRFMDFLNDARAGLTLLQVYDRYIDLVGGAEKAAIEKIKANDDRSTFSGKSKADPTGGTYGLTENQQFLARKNDMSFKEYAEVLKQIPN